MAIAFWICIFIVFYTFFGYGIVLYVLVKLRGVIKGKRKLPANKGDWPTVTVIVAAYNEAGIIREKIANTLGLSYPPFKVRYVFVTDGSSDETPEIIAEYPQIELMHKPQRSGKIAAVHRAMREVVSDVVVFTDANTFLNKEALLNICRHYADKTVGAVSGEKRVSIEEVADATAGEGFYWKYESKLKTWDSELYSVVGAAGELFSIRAALYEPVAPDTILDDFMISMLIAQKGFRIVYEPLAYATESGSENITEELKRKIRIAAGGIQSIVRLAGLLNPFSNFILSFQYISHRVLRWTVTPFLMIAAFVLNLLLLRVSGVGMVYVVIFAFQCLFYGMALLGWFLEKKAVRIKVLFIPYYFCMMNYAVVAGINRYLQKKQSAVWEKAKRK
ncbi:MAG: glycosyltransferase family 2 protein [Chitinophagia bacterium]|nr:glycosyltransferase family 2 protein [Chitinophagia bacterium]